MRRFIPVLAVSAVAASIGGCPNVADTSGIAVACWDLNGNGLPDPDEDLNGDGVVDVLDCRGEAGPAGADGRDGMDGANGQDGAAAPEWLYGDGSSGARIISGDVRFETADDANQLWTDFTVASGATLRVQSGAVLRCTGTFTNNGTIIVETGAQGGDRSAFDSTTLEGVSRPAAIGVNTLTASGGEIGDATADRAGGLGADGISEFEARVALRISTRAGSGGGAALGGGATGGGGMTVFAQGRIENFGTIQADGGDATDDGGGGGGGGVVILASADSINHAATGDLLARGGAGGTAADSAGPGGGGGGGIVHLIAPVIEDLGAASAAGGDAGPVPEGLMITATMRAGGGGGGGSGGAGGTGGAVSPGAAGAPGAAQDGVSGYILRTFRKPELLFR